MRVAFTIILNGKHHLEHNDWFARVAETMDAWVIAEGATVPTGSTAWCKPVPDKYQKHGLSVDGTTQWLGKHRYDKAGVINIGCPGANKDQMVNACLDLLRGMFLTGEEVFLWQLDCDEQWDWDRMYEAERQLVRENATCGCFHSDYYVGENLLAKGCWGEGNDPDDPMKNAYRRLWRWYGQEFLTHEPPALQGGNGKEVLIPLRFRHYAYRFRKDVEFKNDYYSGHEGILDKWDALQAMPGTEFPRPISDLITGPWGQTKTEIVWKP